MVDQFVRSVLKSIVSGTERPASSWVYPGQAVPGERLVSC